MQLLLNIVEVKVEIRHRQSTVEMTILENILNDRGS